jgi:release factor glutamine methyltransferase
VAPGTVACLLAGSGLDPSEARLLLSHASGTPRESLVAHPERQVDADAAARFSDLCRRRADGEPVAYLVGEREFYGRCFKVDRSVLIPRPETEMLVQLALESLTGREQARILDLGTGSGCIAITLALERPGLAVTAAERSGAALARARANAAALGAAVRFVQSDWYFGVEGRFDLIVSNPPYVAAGDPHLAGLAYEPSEALSDGGDGLDSLRAVIVGAAGHLEGEGVLAVEHGFDQADAVREAMRTCGFASAQTRCDLAGQPRVSWCRATR